MDLSRRGILGLFGGLTGSAASGVSPEKFVSILNSSDYSDEIRDLHNKVSRVNDEPLNAIGSGIGSDSNEMVDIIKQIFDLELKDWQLREILENYITLVYEHREFRIPHKFKNKKSWSDTYKVSEAKKEVMKKSLESLIIRYHTQNRIRDIYGPDSGNSVTMGEWLIRKLGFKDIIKQPTKPELDNLKSQVLGDI